MSTEDFQEDFQPRVVAAPDWLRDVALTHRGLHDDGVPENSLAAFAAARDADFGIELDVRLSADGVPVVVHDAMVDLDGEQVAVAKLTVAQLADVTLDGTDEAVPTLADALATAGPAPVMVEVKNEWPRAGRLEAATVTALVAHDDADGGGPTCVASFNPWTLRWLRRRRPAVDRVVTGPLPVEGLPAGVRWPVRSLRLLSHIDPVALSHDIAHLDDEEVQAWRDGGGTVVTWTVRSEDHLATAATAADNIIFEGLAVDRVHEWAGS